MSNTLKGVLFLAGPVVLLFVLLFISGVLRIFLAPESSAASVISMIFPIIIGLNALIIPVGIGFAIYYFSRKNK